MIGWTIRCQVTVFSHGRVVTDTRGNFKANSSNGKGTKTFANGDKYVGDWVDSRKAGQGVYTWANGDRYEGQFNADNFDGKGTKELRKTGTHMWVIGSMTAWQAKVCIHGRVVAGTKVDGRMAKRMVRGQSITRIVGSM